MESVNYLGKNICRVKKDMSFVKYREIYHLIYAAGEAWIVNKLWKCQKPEEHSELDCITYAHNNEYLLEEKIYPVSTESCEL